MTTKCIAVDSAENPEACPHCGWVDPDLWEYHREGAHDAECSNCGKDIVVDVRITVYREVRSPGAGK